MTVVALAALCSASGRWASSRPFPIGVLVGITVLRARR